MHWRRRFWQSFGPRCRKDLPHRAVEVEVAVEVGAAVVEDRLAAGAPLWGAIGAMSAPVIIPVAIMEAAEIMVTAVVAMALGTAAVLAAVTMQTTTTTRRRCKVTNPFTRQITVRSQHPAIMAA